jgi:hypothetical protein
MRSNNIIPILSRLVICLPAICFLGEAWAQQPNITNQTIIWHADQVLEKHSGETVQQAIDIKTVSTETIGLSYPNQVLVFTIDSVQGSWESPDVDGALVYNVRYENTAAGKVKVTREVGSIQIEIDFTEANAYGLHQVFMVSTFNVE